ncbi:MAG: AAA family ATPase [Planctomycetota bacterium]
MSTAIRPSTPRPRSGARPASAPARAAVGARSIDPIRVLRRHFLIIIAAGILGGMIGMGAHLALARYLPLYRGDVIFEVQPGVAEAEDIGASEFANDDAVLRIGNTETLLLTSRDVLQSAITTNEVRQTTWAKKFIENDVLDFNKAIDDLEEDIKAGAVRGTQVFRLSWTARDKTDVPIVLSNITDAYLRKRDALDSKVYTDNLEIFQSQFNAIVRDLRVANEDIKTFIRDKGITTFNDPVQSEIGRSLQNLGEDIADMTSAIDMTSTAYEQTSLKLQGSLEPSSEDTLVAEQDPRMMAFFQQELNLRTDLRVALEKYQPDHPVALEYQRRLDATRKERDSELENIIRRNLESQLKVQADEIERFDRTLKRMEEEYGAKEKDLASLAADTADYEAQEERRKFLEVQRDATQQLINEIKLIRLRADAQRVRVLEPAVEPTEPFFPKVYIIVPLGVMAITGLTIGLIFLRELTDQRVKSASDLAVIPHARVLGVIPERDEDPTKVDHAELAIRRFPYSVLAESYRQATTSVCREIDRGGHQTLLLVGGLPGAGTTTLATNMAAASANFGRRVLIVDANFRRPRLAEAMGFDSDRPGLGDVLADEVASESAIITDDSNVDIMPAGTPPFRVFERLNTPRFDSLLAELRGRYDLIIFDAAPCVVAGDAMILANKTDAAVLVVRANQEYRGLVSRLSHQLMETRSEFLGMVLNRPRGTAGGYFKKNYATMAEYASSGNAGRKKKKSA